MKYRKLTPENEETSLPEQQEI